MAFPSSGGNTSFSIENLRPAYSHTNATSGSYVTAVSVQGSGIVSSLYQYVTSTSIGSLRITIDGIVVFDDTSFSSSTTGTPNIHPSLTMNYRFNSSLLVEHAATAAQTVHTFVTYLVA